MTIRVRQISPCSVKPVIALRKKKAGPLFMRSRRTAYLAIRFGQKTVINSKPLRTTPSRENLISCWCSCLTELEGLRMRRHLSSSGSSRMASRYGVPRRVSSGLTTIPTSSPITSASGRQMERAKKPPSAPKPPWVGGFKGGVAPYGYDLVKSGKVNKRKHELFELALNEAEAVVVRIIFDKYVNEGYGAQRIATHLNQLGYRARSGKMWHHATIRGIVCNLTYTGVLRSGESRSEVQPHLQIIAPEMFEAAQRIRTSRANAAEAERTVPLNVGGRSLLSGNVFCGHCGSRLALTTNGKAYPCTAIPVGRTPTVS